VASPTSLESLVIKKKKRGEIKQVRLPYLYDATGEKKRGTRGSTTGTAFLYLGRVGHTRAADEEKEGDVPEKGFLFNILSYTPDGGKKKRVPINRREGGRVPRTSLYPKFGLKKVVSSCLERKERKKGELWRKERPSMARRAHRE